MSSEKNFKIKIGLNAILVDSIKPDPEPTMNLREAVQEWWKVLGKEQLEDYLNNNVRSVTYKSYLRGFSASDTVDKETYE